MNKLIFRKLYFDIFTFFILSSLAITAIVWVIQGVNLLDIVTEHGHSFKVYFIFSLLSIPKIFSKLIIFSYFLSLYIIINRYEENNEILVFWTNGIKKISFINFIGKISILFVIIQLILNLYLVPYTQNLKQEYLKNSSKNIFPKLIQDKRFTNITKELTIFVEENEKNGMLKGIYIKEKLKNNESKIITAKKGKLVNDQNKFSFKLFDGKITNVDKTGSINLNFKETIYQLSKLDSNIRKTDKLNEIKSSFLVECLEKFFNKRKDEEKRCGKGSSFLIKEIYEEVFKRAINPIYIIILSLISSLVVLKPKVNFFENYLKIILFSTGFTIILFSNLSYKFIYFSTLIEILFLFLPVLFVFIFYLILFLKSKFNMAHL